MKHVYWISILLVVGLSVGLLNRRAYRRAEGHQIARTRADLAVISYALKTSFSLRGVGISRSFVTNLDAAVLYRLLSATNGRVRLLEARPDWDSAGSLVDRWGRPVLVQARLRDSSIDGGTTGPVAQLRIWSAGPNGKDEGGGGDDVVSDPVDVPLR